MMKLKKKMRRREDTEGPCQQMREREERKEKRERRMVQL
jgi:hypothetical protein